MGPLTRIAMSLDALLLAWLILMLVVAYAFDGHEPQWVRVTGGASIFLFGFTMLATFVCGIWGL